MNKKHSALIAALTLTAILLGVILIATPTRPAEAAMINAQPDFTLMTTGALGGDEGLIIIDKNAQKMIVYTLLNGNKLNVIAGYPIKRPAGAAPAPVR